MRNDKKLGKALVNLALQQSEDDFMNQMDNLFNEFDEKMPIY